MTRGGAATPEPFDISEISRSGDLLDALAARGFADPAGGGRTASDDPAVRLLAALVADVDIDAPPLPVSPRPSHSGAKPGRPVVRAFVTFGVATLMLTSAGAAVAGGGGADRPGTAAGPPVTRGDVSEHARTEVGVVPVAQPMAPLAETRRRADRDAAPRPPSRRDEPDSGHRPSGPPAAGPVSPSKHVPVDHGTGGAGPTPRGSEPSTSPSPYPGSPRPVGDDPPRNAAPRVPRSQAAPADGRARSRGDGALGRAFTAVTGRGAAWGTPRWNGGTRAPR